MLVSELVTNALVHATRHDQLIRLSLEVDEDLLWITVEDASDTLPQQRGDADGESGRGLLLVDALSEAWGWGPREGIGKQVWCVCEPDPVVGQGRIAALDSTRRNCWATTRVESSMTG